MSDRKTFEMICAYENTIKGLEQQLKTQSDKVEILTDAADEALAIIAHISPDTYNNNSALAMVAIEMLKALKSVKGEL